MNLDNIKISRLQLYLLIFTYIIGSSLLLSIVDSLAEQDIWIVIILAMLEDAVFIFVIVTLARRFSGKTLIEINDTVYGSVLGKIVSLLYIIFFFLLLPLNLRYISDFYSNTILENTPTIAIIISITVLCIYAVKKGLEVINRCCFIIIFLFIVEVLFTLIALSYKINFTNFLPLMEISSNELIKATNITTAIPFGELVIFLMIFPLVKNNKKIFKPTYLALLSAGLVLIIIAARNVSVLGSTASLFTYPSYQVARLINIKDIVTRVEVLMAVTILTAIFVKISVIYYAVVTASGRFFNLNEYSSLVIPLGFLVVPLSLISFEFFVQQIRFGVNIYPFIAIPIEFGLPLLTLIVAKIRKKGEAQG